MSQTTIKTYEIDGKTYVQEELSFGQWQQLNRIIDGLEIPAQLTPYALTAAFADRLDQILAVVLTEKDIKPWEKDLPELAKQLAFAMSPEKVAEVVTDFFDCNPIHLILDLVVGVTQKITQTVSQATGSSNASSSSVEETGPSETKSSGD
ncbi:hypothetical protein [uncultured Desulfuromusa sp.]|uniref:hypothetical protein n=1 Tax=uncultured Desulfuromusa sp. TaxID=219183 RepID=UPI002AA8830E|nr:hypothetical protein [uncultured Desulfuromusa sp.]